MSFGNLAHVLKSSYAQHVIICQTKVVPNLGRGSLASSYHNTRKKKESRGPNREGSVKTNALIYFVQQKQI
jgi:hypothetical protein